MLSRSFPRKYHVPHCCLNFLGAQDSELMLHGLEGTSRDLPMVPKKEHGTLFINIRLYGQVMGTRTKTFLESQTLTPLCLPKVLAPGQLEKFITTILFLNIFLGPWVLPQLHDYKWRLDGLDASLKWQGRWKKVHSSAFYICSPHTRCL